MLASLLPLSEHSSTYESVLSQGVKLGDIEIPLHAYYLKSDLMNGLESRKW